MGVRPPQQGDDEELATVAFGIAALDEHLERAELVFPATDDELLGALGNPEVPFDAKGNTVRFAEVLEEAHASRYETRQELLNALHPVFEAKRERANNSFVGRVRSLLPF